MLSAVIQNGSSQVIAKQGEVVLINRIDREIGESFDIKPVLIMSEEKISLPSGESFVRAKVLSHDRGDKITVFKKRRRKNYRRRNGFRASYTKLLIESVS